jgi:hypothetical protein
MIVYQVTLSIERGIEPEWFEWMQRVHIPDVLRTGCFSRCDIFKNIDAGPGDATYVLQYRANDREDYERYRDTYAPRLQREHSELFAGRFRASRLLLEEAGSLCEKA